MSSTCTKHCFYCHQLGHIIADCKRLKKDKLKGSKNARKQCTYHNGRSNSYDVCYSNQKGHSSTVGKSKGKSEKPFPVDVLEMICSKLMLLQL